MSGFTGYAPTVKIKRKGDAPPDPRETFRADLERRAREHLVGRVVEDVTISGDVIEIQAAGGAVFALEYTAGLKEAQ
jgi:hypothetical protein